MRLKEAEKLEPKEVHLGFIAAIAAALAAAVSADSIIKTIQAPHINPVTIPGVLATRGVGSDIIEKINKSKQELEAAHQREIKLSEKQKQLEQQILQREALKQKIIKLAPFVAAGGVVLGVVLLIRRKR